MSRTNSTQRALEGKIKMDELLGAIGQMMPFVTCGAELARCWTKGKQPGLAVCTRCRTTSYYSTGEFSAVERICR